MIVSHTPEAVDGNRHREILSQWTGAFMSFGDFAVDGFFVISGFLIMGSYLSTKSLPDYLLKRVLRIYPAFLLSSIICLVLVAPLAGGVLDNGLWRTAASSLARMALLARPMINGAFKGQYGADLGGALNGPAWTIQYEFACYLLVPIVVACGVLKRPALLPIAAIIALCLMNVNEIDGLRWLSSRNLFPAPPTGGLRLLGMFLAGCSYFVFQQHVQFTRTMIVIATIGLIGSLHYTLTANLGFAVFGGYLIFAVARLANSSWLSRINNDQDISYGLYLSAGPIMRMLVMYVGFNSLLLYGVTTWVLAAGYGLLSWKLVERPSSILTKRLLESHPALSTRLAT